MDVYLTDSREDMGDYELIDLDLQGIEEASKQSIPIPEPQLKLFKRSLIKSRISSGKIFNTNANDHSFGIKWNGRKDMKRQHQVDNKKGRISNRKRLLEVDSLMLYSS